MKKELANYDNILMQAGPTLGPAGKPLKNRFIAQIIKKRINEGESVEKALPKTSMEIITKIKDLSCPENNFKKLTK